MYHDNIFFPLEISWWQLSLLMIEKSNFTASFKLVLFQQSKQEILVEADKPHCRMTMQSGVWWSFRDKLYFYYVFQNERDLFVTEYPEIHKVTRADLVSVLINMFVTGYKHDQVSIVIEMSHPSVICDIS